ncbi:SCO2322 family protein [Nonomuraea sp. 10N515B]|uniref:SCO2322 family protein n=1 Tax=Nonomuraea sp. 10N515B TaxID=3457422 RepID=UPI003FCE8639
MLRAYRVAAGVALGAAAFLSLPSSALASPSINPNAPLPGVADPHATRLWSVWQSDGTAWLATAAGDTPADGSVIGWRFSAAPDGAASESPGGDLPAFETVCGKDAAASGHKRVAVAVDFGDGDTDAYPGDQPPAQGVLTCVAGTEDATTAQLLATAAKVRVNGQGDVVAVNDYPAKEKGGTQLTAAAPAAGGGGGGVPVALIAGGAGALALIAGGAVVATRRRAKPSTPAAR